jgi:hypothetical protein
LKDVRLTLLSSRVGLIRRGVLTASVMATVPPTTIIPGDCRRIWTSYNSMSSLQASRTSTREIWRRRKRSAELISRRGVSPDGRPCSRGSRRASSGTGRLSSYWGVPSPFPNLSFPSRGSSTTISPPVTALVSHLENVVRKSSIKQAIIAMTSAQQIHFVLNLTLHRSSYFAIDSVQGTAILSRQLIGSFRFFRLSYGQKKRRWSRSHHSLLDSKFQTAHEVADFGRFIKLKHLKIFHHFRGIFAHLPFLSFEEKLTH